MGAAGSNRFEVSQFRNVSPSLFTFPDALLVFPFATITRINGAQPAPGTSNSRQNWFHMILPYCEQANLYNQFSPQWEANVFPGNWTGANTIIPMFQCPSDPNNPKISNQGFHGNYLPCHGSTHSGANNTFAATNGLLYPISRTSMRSVTDGTSNTIMFSEIRLQKDGTVASGAGNVVCGSPHDLRGRYYNSYHGNSTFTTLRPPNTLIGDIMQYCAGTPQVPCRSCSGGGGVELHTRSYHVGGVQSALVDGSVRFFSDNIDTALFQGLGTISTGEVLGEF